MAASVEEPRTTLQRRRTFDATPDEVFRTWTDSELLRQWLGPPEGSTPSAELDVRVGGEYRIEMAATGAPTAYVVGKYIEIDPPRRLVFTWGWEGLPQVELEDSLVTVELHDRGGATEMVLTHERLKTRGLRDFHSWGWEHSLERLGPLLARGE